jgi:hypothetical protein
MLVVHWGQHSEISATLSTRGPGASHLDLRAFSALRTQVVEIRTASQSPCRLEVSVSGGQTDGSSDPKGASSNATCPLFRYYRTRPDATA